MFTSIFYNSDNIFGWGVSMKGKSTFIITALISILMLSACGQKNDSCTIATTTNSTITKSDFEKQLKDRYGKDTLYEMVAQDVITKNIKYLMMQ